MNATRYKFGSSIGRGEMSLIARGLIPGVLKLIPGPTHGGINCRQPGKQNRAVWRGLPGVNGHKPASGAARQKDTCKRAEKNQSACLGSFRLWGRFAHWPKL